MGCTCACDKEKLFNSGVLVEHTEGAVLPPKEAWEAKKGGYAVIECPKRIPCNPCYTSCPTGAVLPFEDINDVPRIDYAKCTGCGICVSRCPGLACFVIDMTYALDKAVVKLPYEMIAVTEPSKDRTYVVSVVIPKELTDQIRAVAVNAPACLRPEEEC